MKDQSHGPVIGIPVTDVSFAGQLLSEERASEAPPPAAVAADNEAYGLTLCDDCKIAAKKDSVVDWVSRLRMKINRRVRCTREPRTSQAVKEKWRRVFREAFPPAATEKEPEETLVKSSQCHLSTTAGPIQGTLFISTARIAFLSNAPLKITSHDGAHDIITSFRYKVVIPVSRIKDAIPVQNLKYIQILTADEYEFWFMGFVDPEAFFNDLKKAISKVHGFPIT